MSVMKRIGIIANCGKPHAREVLRRLSASARELGLSLVANGMTARLLKTAEVIPLDKPVRKLDALMALGGDGTMLKAVRMLDGRDIPVIGVNIGSLGFLTSVMEEDLVKALKCLSADKFLASVRAIVECRIKAGGRIAGRYRALNEVVIHNGASGRVINLEVSINGERVTSYVCDGLIVSTPTGSTGHSLSAGGPILVPEAPVFIINLICPHALSSRAVVVPDDSLISIVVAGTSGNARLSVDGQVDRSLKQGECAQIRRSPKSVTFIHLPGYSYFSLLREKLHWRGSNL